MSLLEYLNQLWDLITKKPTIGVGIVIALIGLFFLITELKTKFQHGTTSENLMLSFIALTFGLILAFLQDWLMAIALSFFVLAVYQTFQLRESPVWRELMITSTVTYFVFLLGTILSKVTGNDIYTGWAYNLMIYVFLILALIFFGKKFILVSRLMSPQILYLTLYAFAYVILYTVSNLLPSAEKLSWYFLPINKNIADRVIFLSLAPYELIIIISFFLYFISGWLLTLLLGIKPVTDERILKLVDEVRQRLGIRWRVKVGFVKAPILNAFAFGPFFDQRVAFISKDLSDFTDDDIRGIVAHELAHNSRHHIIWLQIIASAEMIIKKALLLPATTLDYAAYEQKVPFIVYFLINYGIIAFLLIFVRILEGDADLQTKKAGYGKELAQALYKLEGFYHGIAGDFGLNVQLLTGKEFTKEERQRFLGEAAISLYKHLYRPGRWAMISNIFMSHPRTAFRIVAAVEEDLSPVKSALLPYWLILPDFIRKKAIRKLSKKRDQFAKLINEAYYQAYGKEGIENFLKITRLKEFYTPYVGHYSVAYDYIFDKVIEGKIVDIVSTDSICTPIQMVIEKSDHEREYANIFDFEIYEAEIGEHYILKDGTIAKLISWERKGKSNRPIFKFEPVIQKSKNKKKTFKSYYTGKPKRYFEELIGKNIFLYKNALDRKAIIKQIDFNNKIGESKFILEIDEKDNPEELEIMGRKLIIELPPVMVAVNKEKEKMNIQNGMLKMLIGNSVILYTKEELEVGVACEITEIDEEKIIYKTNSKTQEIPRKKVDYIFVYADIPKFMLRDHLSIGDRLQIKLTNLREFKFILP